MTETTGPGFAGGVEYAPAKLNLYLHVTGRRDDGYHLLDSLVAFAAVGDTLRVEPADDLSLALTGPFAAGLTAEPDNLVLRAARALAAEAKVASGARLTLDKRLPVASGIGGGSADAAAALRLLCHLWRLSPNPTTLERIALRLGADVPICLRCQPARMRGVGEYLTQAPKLPVCGLVLANPGVAVSTADVFRIRQGGFSPPALLPPAWPNPAMMAAGLRALHNDLQATACALAPAIGSVLAVLDSLPGCLLARMSGSGATCFGLFADEAEATQAAAAVARDGWWVWGGGLHLP